MKFGRRGGRSEGANAAPPRVGLQLGWRLEAGRQVIQGVLDYAEEHGPWEFAYDMSFDPHFPSMQPLDGMIALARNAREGTRLRRLRIPVVLTTGPSHDGQPRVTFDDIAIGRMAAEYYMDRGFDELAYYSHFPPDPDDRLTGFTEAARKAGVRVHVLTSDEPTNLLNLAKRNRNIGRWLQGLPKPVAVFAYNDVDAIEVAEAAHELGVHIPEEVALLGVDNDPVLNRLCRPRLSSVDHGAHQLGYRAAAMLAELMAGRKLAQIVELIKPVGVVSRQSTDTLAVGDADVVMALRLIRDKACNGLRAETVVKHVSLSRTSLETRFQKLLGRSVHQEIVRVRMEMAKHLLRATDLDMPEITMRSGFRYPSQVSHLFRRHLGMSPREYRRKMRTTG